MRTGGGVSDFGLRRFFKTKKTTIARITSAAITPPTPPAIAAVLELSFFGGRGGGGGGGDGGDGGDGGGGTGPSPSAGGSAPPPGVGAGGPGGSGGCKFIATLEQRVNCTHACEGHTCVGHPKGLPHMVRPANVRDQNCEASINCNDTSETSEGCLRRRCPRMHWSGRLGNAFERAVLACKAWHRQGRAEGGIERSRRWCTMDFATL